MSGFTRAKGLQPTINYRQACLSSNKQLAVKHSFLEQKSRPSSPAGSVDNDSAVSCDSNYSDDDIEHGRSLFNTLTRTQANPSFPLANSSRGYRRHFIPGPKEKYTGTQISGTRTFPPAYLRFNIFNQADAAYFAINPEAAPRIALRSRTIDPGDRNITVLCLSNLFTANMPHLPAADILVLAGGLTDGEIGSGDARLYELHVLVARRKFQHIVVIGRGTDAWLDPRLDDHHAANPAEEDGPTAQNLRDMIIEYSPWMIYLKNSCVSLTVRGRNIRVVGVSGQMTADEYDSEVAFPYHPDRAANVWRVVPENVDILVTWMPPAGYLDDGKGDVELEKCLWEKRPRAVIFGHPEAERGLVRMRFDEEHREYQTAIADYMEELAMARRASRDTGLVFRVREVIRPPLWDAPIPDESWTPGEGEAILVNASYSHEDNALELDPILIRI